MSPAQSRTSTVMCADVAPVERDRWLADLARTESGVAIDFSAEIAMVAFDSASAAVEPCRGRCPRRAPQPHRAT